MSDVNVTIGATLGELKQGLTEAGQLVKGFKENASKAKETAQFLANGIQQIGGASSQAAALAGNLLGGFASGGIMGLAIGGVNALIAVIKESGEAEKKAAEQTQEALAQRRAEYEKTAREAARLKAIESGQTAASFDAKQKGGTAQQQQMVAQDAVDRARERLNALLKKSGYGAGGDDAALGQSRVSFEQAAEYAPELKQALNELREAEHYLALAVQQRADVEYQGTIETKNAQQELDDKTRAAQNAARAVQSQVAAGAALTEAEKERILSADRLRAIEERQIQAAQTLHGETKEKVLHSLLQERAATIALNEQLEHQAELKDRIFDPSIARPVPAAEIEKPEGILETQKYDANRHNVNLAAAIESTDAPIKKYQEEVKKAQKANEELLDTGLALGESFGQTFAQMATGQRTVGQGFAAMGQQMIGVILDVVKKQIMANAAGAASGAASSQSAIPIIGPVLAVAAMTAMLSTVQGLLGNLPSAAGGYDIPGTINPLVQAHAKEMVLPAKYAEGFRDIINNGRTGGGITLNVSTMNAKSFEDALRDNDSSLIKVLNEAIADRRF